MIVMIGAIKWGLKLKMVAMGALFAFVAVLGLSSEIVRAADAMKFNPGYIISDYQMTNYQSMNENEIQAFLKKNNACNDKRTHLTSNNVDKLSESSPYSWHVKDGHYVCLADEVFKEGTAAHIIWRAAQDYKINPQVLIVLLQKEQGLITDTLPNSIQYRSATGFGCPDTAACDAKYYGFNNQVRNAAELFRKVMDGGWTNFPLGDNYIQYSPNAACGGAIVNVQNRATSALYRYTPYQPNAGALAAGYGTTTCGAYGNRNFYLYFEDWFGDITGEGGWEAMSLPRVMKVKQATLQVDPLTKTTHNKWMQPGHKYYFTSKMNVYWGGNIEVCLRTAEDTVNNINRCTIMSRLENTDEKLYDVVSNSDKYLLVNSNTKKYDLSTNQELQTILLNEHYSIKFSQKVKYNDTIYYRTAHDLNNNIEAFIPGSALKEIEFVKFMSPRNMMVKENKFIDLKTGKSCKNIKPGFVGRFVTKIERADEVFYRLEENGGDSCVIRAEYVSEVGQIGLLKSIKQFVGFVRPRKLIQANGAYAWDLSNGRTCEYVDKGTISKYTTKVDTDSGTYFRSEKATTDSSYCAMKASELREI